MRIHHIVQLLLLKGGSLDAQQANVRVHQQPWHPLVLRLTPAAEVWSRSTACRGPVQRTRTGIPWWWAAAAGPPVAGQGVGSESAGKGVC